MKRAIVEAVAIVLAAAILALGANALRPGGIELLPNPNPAPPAGPAAAGSGEPAGSREIGLDTALEIAADGQALFVDARSPEEYRRGHIRGARNLPALRADAWLPDFFSAVDPARPVIAYCHGEQCDLASQLAAILTAAGYQKVYYLLDGWGHWQQRGLPVERGAE